MSDHESEIVVGTCRRQVPTTNTNRTILAIETSCDETAAAIVQNGRTIVRNVVASQMEMHQRYGGIVPEVASRQHILSIIPVLQETLEGVPNGWDDIDAVAATFGPGLSGALLTGLNTAKAIAWQRDLPFIGVNHLEAHIYANWLAVENDSSFSQPEFPAIALVVSGGHTLLALLADHGDYQILGQTRDDAAGEAFDKVARILGLGYPGGPVIEKTAKEVEKGITLPRAWLRDSYDFSFSGLKTAVLHKTQEHLGQPFNVPASGGRVRRGRRVKEESPDTEPASKPTPSIPTAQFYAQIAHGFQESVVDVLVQKTIRAAHEYHARQILLAGGVAANALLRSELQRRSDVAVQCPPIWLCTDNAAMVAAAAYYRFQAGVQHGWELDVKPNLALGG